MWAIAPAEWRQYNFIYGAQSIKKAKCLSHNNVLVAQDNPKTRKYPTNSITLVEKGSNRTSNLTLKQSKNNEFHQQDLLKIKRKRIKTREAFEWNQANIPVSFSKLTMRCEHQKYKTFSICLGVNRIILAIFSSLDVNWTNTDTQ